MVLRCSFFSSGGMVCALLLFVWSCVISSNAAVAAALDNKEHENSNHIVLEKQEAQALLRGRSTHNNGHLQRSYEGIQESGGIDHDAFADIYEAKMTLEDEDSVDSDDNNNDNMSFAVVRTLQQRKLDHIDDPYFPYVRYKLWTQLSEAQQNQARGLGYRRQRLWNQIGTMAREAFSYWNEDELTDNQRLRVRRLFNRFETFIDEEDGQEYDLAGYVWDCYVNHYDDYAWGELVAEGVAVYWEALGWNRNMWNNGVGAPPPTNDLNFTQLDPDQLNAAEELCYFEETWNEEPLDMRDWEELPMSHPPTEQPTTALPTTTPTAQPSTSPTEQPTKAPTESPTTEEPTLQPTEEPTLQPTTAEPTESPTEEPTLEPTEEPTEQPTPEPTDAPTEQPTNAPTEAPTVPPKTDESDMPSAFPSEFPTEDYSSFPSDMPSDFPTEDYSMFPSEFPSEFPSPEDTPEPTLPCGLETLAPSPGFPPCPVCGPNQEVTKPQNIVLVPGDGPRTCCEVELGGQNGFVDPGLCPLVPAFIAETCGCQDPRFLGPPIVLTENPSSSP